MRAPCSTPPRFIAKAVGSVMKLVAGGMNSLMPVAQSTRCSLLNFAAAAIGRQRRQPFVVGAFIQAFEQEGREIALASIWQHREKDRSPWCAFGDMQGGRHGGTGGDSDEYSFFSGKPARGVAPPYFVYG